jgi:ABC-type nitrate/sulfonate/bicarbonate transport system substrate-binding protein
MINNNRRKKMKKRILVVVLVVIMIFSLLTACKDAGKPGTGELTEVTFVLPRTIEVLEDTPFWAATNMGYWAEEGLKVNIIQSFGTTDVKMVATGQAEFCVPGTSYVLTSVVNELPVKAVYQYDAVNIWVMAYLKNSGIKTWADMKGKTVALGDASWEALIAPTLAAAGLDVANDLEFIVAGENRFVQVQEGKIDLLFSWLGEIYQLQGQGFDFDFLWGDDVLQTCGNPVVTSLYMINNSPEIVEGFIRGIAKGAYFVYVNPEAGADISCAQFPNIQVPWDAAIGIQNGRVAQMFGVGEATNKKMLEKIGWHFEDKWRTTVDGSVGLIDGLKADIDFDLIYTNEFIAAANDWDRKEIEEDAKNYVYKVRDKYK